MLRESLLNGAAWALVLSCLWFGLVSERTVAEEGSPVDVEKVKSDPGAKLVEVPYLNQLDVVFGCEAVSATMVLQFYGCDITWKEFTDVYLIKKPWRVDENGKRFGPDPFAAYPGDPYKDSGPNSGYGCYAPCLAKSLNKVLPQEKYVDVGEPVIVWATMDMRPSRLTSSWEIDYVDENSPYRLGDTHTWNGNEHCLVLVGYDETRYFFNDPYKNHGLIGYDRALVEARFHEQGSQSVVVRKVER